MKIVIVGNGKVGFALSAQLSREGHDIMVIDNKKEVVGESSERLDIMSVRGNGAGMEVQRTAGVGGCDLLIAATSLDEVNLLCCLVARKLGCKRTIARVRDPEYTGLLAAMKEDLGLSMAINPEKAAAYEIFNIIRFPSFLKTEAFAKGRARMVEVILPDDSPYIGKRLRELYDLSQIRVLICVVQRGDETFIPDGNFVLCRGDRLFATAPSYNLDKLIGLLGVETRRITDVLVVGGSRIAHYLAEDLLKAGINVKIIEQRAERCAELADILPKAVIIKGDGTSQRILLGEGVRGADAVVTLTDFDEENLIISMYANYLGVARVITKINRTEYNEVFKGKGIDCVVSPKDLTVNTILRYVRSMHNAGPETMVALHRLADGSAEAMEFIATASTLNLGRPLKDITFRKNILLACISRGSRAIVPKGMDYIEEGDSVFVVAPSSLKLSELNDIFQTGDEAAGPAAH